MKNDQNVLRTSIAAAEFEAIYQEINDLKIQIKDLQNVVNNNKSVVHELLDVLAGAEIPYRKN